MFVPGQQSPPIRSSPNRALPDRRPPLSIDEDDDGNASYDDEDIVMCLIMCLYVYNAEELVNCSERLALDWSSILPF